MRPVLLTSILTRLVMPLGFSNIMMILCKSFLFPLNCLLVSNVVIVSLYLFVLPPPSPSPPPLSLSLSLSRSLTHFIQTQLSGVKLMYLHSLSGPLQSFTFLSICSYFRGSLASSYAPLLSNSSKLWPKRVAMHCTHFLRSLKLLLIVSYLLP